MQRTLWILFLLLLWNCSAWPQTLKQRPMPPSHASSASPLNTVPIAIALTVPAGAALKVALTEDVRIQKRGQPIHARVLEPIYVFDKQVIPAGSEVTGKIMDIASIPKEKRAFAAMNADFSPARAVRIEFDELLLPSGQHMAIKTNVVPGSAGVLQFIPADEKKKNATEKEKEIVSRKIDELRQQVKSGWHTATDQLHSPNKFHRVERYAVGRLPYHPQYLDTGTTFDAEMVKPLDFGSEPVNAGTVSSIGLQPPSGSLVHAVLLTALSSATNKRGDPVAAEITRPLVVGGRLLLPEGSRLKGSILEVHRARRLNRNGQLRIVFHKITPPNGIEQSVEASLEGVAVSKGDHLKLDSEGGAQVTTPKTRYLTTGIAIVLATSSASPDHDRVDRDGGGPDAGGGTANGLSGFGFLGGIISYAAHSRAVSTGFGFYGAGLSTYTHFIARGRDVVYPKDMSMIVGLSSNTRGAKPIASVPKATQAKLQLRNAVR
jgi:hypothetical protein